jgi:hypothetical protein
MFSTTLRKVLVIGGTAITFFTGGVFAGRTILASKETKAMKKAKAKKAEAEAAKNAA